MTPPSALPKPTVARAFKYRAYPTTTQVVALEEQLAFCCDLYNAALEQRRDAWRRGRRVAYYDQQRELTDLRASFPYPEGMAGHLQRDPLRRLDKAFQAFFRRCRSGEKPGYPRFRSKVRYDSLTWPHGHGASFDGKRVRLKGVGPVRVRYHRDLPEGAEVREITVRRRCGWWFVCVSCVVPSEPATHSGPAVGLDLGVRNFVALSTGEIVTGLGSDRAGTRLALRKVARRKRASRRHRKAVVLLARRRYREANRRRDFAHKLSRQLVDQYGLVAVEDLKIAQMRRSARGTLEEPGRNVRAKAGLNRRMAEQSWGQFIEFLDYKAEEAGTQVVKVGPRFTSQTCAQCGYVASESRKAEKFVCVACGHRDDADVNAARNILALGLGQSLRAPTVGVEVRTVA